MRQLFVDIQTVFVTYVAEDKVCPCSLSMWLFRQPMLVNISFHTVQGYKVYSWSFSVNALSLCGFSDSLRCCTLCHTYCRESKSVHVLSLCGFSESLHSYPLHHLCCRGSKSVHDSSLFRQSAPLNILSHILQTFKSALSPRVFLGSCHCCIICGNFYMWILPQSSWHRSAPQPAKRTPSRQCSQSPNKTLSNPMVPYMKQAHGLQKNP